MLQSQTFKVKGMNRDISEVNAAGQFAYEIYNMRVLATEDNTSFSLVTEKSTKEVTFSTSESIKGNVVGAALLYDILYIFTTTCTEKLENDSSIPTGDAVSRIYSIKKEDSGKYAVECILDDSVSDNAEAFSTTKSYAIGDFCLYDSSLYICIVAHTGDWDTSHFEKYYPCKKLYLSTQHPLEVIPYFETEAIQKLYWVDGVHQARVYNVISRNLTIDFLPEINLDNTVNITKVAGGGDFPSGVILYVFTYGVKHGQESNIFYTSPLYYLTRDVSSGMPADKNVSCHFDISITGKTIYDETAEKYVDLAPEFNNYDYIYVYSLIRTTLDGEIQCRKVGRYTKEDLSKSATKKITYTNVEEITLPASTDKVVSGAIMPLVYIGDTIKEYSYSNPALGIYYDYENGYPYTITDSGITKGTEKYSSCTNSNNIYRDDDTSYSPFSKLNFSGEKYSINQVNKSGTASVTFNKSDLPYITLQGTDLNLNKDLLLEFSLWSTTESEVTPNKEIYKLILKGFRIEVSISKPSLGATLYTKLYNLGADVYLVDNESATIPYKNNYELAPKWYEALDSTEAVVLLLPAGKDLYSIASEIASVQGAQVYLSIIYERQADLLDSTLSEEGLESFEGNALLFANIKLLKEGAEEKTTDECTSYTDYAYAWDFILQAVKAYVYQNGQIYKDGSLSSASYLQMLLDEYMPQAKRQPATGTNMGGNIVTSPITLLGKSLYWNIYSLGKDPYVLQWDYTLGKSLTSSYAINHQRFALIDKSREIEYADLSEWPLYYNYIKDSTIDYASTDLTAKVYVLPDTYNGYSKPEYGLDNIIAFSSTSGAVSKVETADDAAYNYVKAIYTKWKSIMPTYLDYLAYNSGSSTISYEEGTYLGKKLAAFTFLYGLYTEKTVSVLSGGSLLITLESNDEATSRTTFGEPACPTITLICDNPERLSYKTILKESTVEVSETKAITDSHSSALETIDINHILIDCQRPKIVPSTFDYKDNTLFLGNLKIELVVFSDNLKKKILGTISESSTNTSRFYSSQLGLISRSIAFKNADTQIYGMGEDEECGLLNKPSDVLKVFKSREEYRVGILFITKLGQKSEVIDLGYIKINGLDYNSLTDITTDIYSYYPTYTFTLEAIAALNLTDYIKARLMIEEELDENKSVICLGFVNPTVFRQDLKASGNLSNMSSWFIRPVSGFTSGANPTTYSEGILNEHYRPLYWNGSLFGEILSVTNTPEQSTVSLASSGYAIFINGYCHFLRGRRNKRHYTVHLTEFKIISAGATIVNIENAEKNRWPSHKKSDIDVDWAIEYFLDYLREFMAECPDVYQTIDKVFLENRISSYTDSGRTLNWNFTHHIPFKNSEDVKSKYSQYRLFYVDDSIVDFYSPDIEKYENLIEEENSNLGFRIVGIAPIAYANSDYNISMSTDTHSTALPGVWEGLHGKNNRSLYTLPAYLDDAEDDRTTLTITNATYYLVYPWNRQKSLISQIHDRGSGETEEGTSIDYPAGQWFALLKSKILANEKVCGQTIYLKKPYEYTFGITGCKIWDNDTDANSIIKLPPYTGDTQYISYKGNIDMVYSYSCPISCLGEAVGNATAYNLKRVTSKEYTTAIGSNGVHWQEFSEDNDENYGRVTLAVTKPQKDEGTASESIGEPIRIKYKSGIHAVLAFLLETSSPYILPTIPDSSLESTLTVPWYTSDISIKPISVGHNVDYYPFYSSDNVALQTAHSSSVEAELYLYIGELYRAFTYPTKDPRHINWIPIGDFMDFSTEDVSDLGALTIDYTIYGTEGDHFFGRWDGLVTYPYTDSDTNLVIEIGSVVVESKRNIHARTDKNRNSASNLAVSPKNFNLFNDVYDLSNNIFMYNNSDMEAVTTYNNLFTWTLLKNSAEDIDTWTLVTLASVLTLDGNSGPINKILQWRNNLLAFLDSNISIINYNDRVLIPTSESVPILISNNYKVDGKTVLYNHIGCKNKWSIVPTKDYVYFMDDNYRALFLYSGNAITSLSDDFGFHSFMELEASLDTWTPLNFENFKNFYDLQHQEVYFINGNYCLCYSELLKTFTSFYAYNKTPYLINYDEYVLALRNDKDNLSVSIHLLWQGNTYCNFFNATTTDTEGNTSTYYDDYYVTYISNGSSSDDKTFTNLEFLSEVFNSTTTDPDLYDLELSTKTFDKLEVWNNYLNGDEDFVDTLDRPSNLKRKFRIWRCNLPRAKYYDRVNKEWKLSRDRMRNPWLYIKLWKTNNDGNKLRLDYSSVLFIK